MEKKEFKYDAFISYRHSDLDKFVAENLHKTLENYDIPKNIKDKLNIEGKAIKRIFRDREELPLSSNLEDPIIGALNDSKYLIVICSPRLKDSLWCKKEIETFKKIRGRKNIFCVLIEGEPADSFPEEVLYDEVNGKKVPVEPLAADVRGTTKKEIKKKIEEEKLRLVASMLNIDYDDLKQRHKQREQKRKMMIVTAIASFLLIFSLYTSIMLIKINSQAKTLKEHQALSLASDSERYLQNDNRYDAIKASYEALTKFNKVKMPYTSEAEYALGEALGIYDVGFSYKSMDELKTKGVVDFIKSSDDNKYASIYDESETLTLFDTKSLNVIKEYSVGNVFYEESFAFIGNDKLAFINDKGNIVIVNNKDGKVLEEIKKTDNRYISIQSNFEGDKIAFNDGKNITLYDVKNNKEITKFSTNEKFDRKMFFKKDANYLFAFTHSVQVLSYDEEYVGVHVYDINESKEINSVSFDVGYVDSISTKGDNAFILFSSNTMNGVSTLVVSYNYINGNTNWTRTYNGKWGKFITRSLPEGSSSVVAATRNNIYVLDEANGNDVQEFAVEDEIINIYSFMDEELYLVFLADGTVNYASMKIKDVVEYKDRFMFNADKYKMVTQSSNGFIMVPYNDNRVILYEEKSNKNVKKEDIKLDYIKDQSATVKEIEKIKKEYKINNINLVERYIFSDKKDVLFINYNNGDLAIYNTKDKSLIRTLENVGNITHYFGKDKYGRTYLGDITDSYILDKDYNKVGHIIGLCKLEKDKVYILHNSKYYSLKIYTLDDLLKEAKEYLK